MWTNELWTLHSTVWELWSVFNVQLIFSHIIIVFCFLKESMKCCTNVSCLVAWCYFSGLLTKFILIFSCLDSFSFLFNGNYYLLSDMFIWRHFLKCLHAFKLAILTSIQNLKIFCHFTFFEQTRSWKYLLRHRSRNMAN